MIRLEQIRIDPDAPAFAKPHPKQESIWHRQYPVGFVSANLKVYPQRGTEVNAWRQGIMEATTCIPIAIAVGMTPHAQRDDNDSDSDGNSNDDYGDNDDSDHNSSDGSSDGDDSNKGHESDDNSDNEVSSDDNDDWFYKPFNNPKNRFHDVDTDEDNCDEEETSACDEL
ncbi:hypothetical protein AC249_AIPGENE21797 [Exaiptasia diaphana]|nr:hypothetical protein AC249_AIPGENE21797 [Exaiptasia diaphana]